VLPFFVASGKKRAKTRDSTESGGREEVGHPCVTVAGGYGPHVHSAPNPTLKPDKGAEL
jgi:hypothetical protein